MKKYNFCCKKIFTIHISDKEFVSKLKKFYYSNNEKTTSQLILVKGFNRHFTKNGKYIKSLLLIRVIKIIATMKYCYIPLEWLKFKFDNTKD